ncbi:hypothetical protein DITRI_Ditri02bG0058700 [Diplodiscus trichospermus]
MADIFSVTSLQETLCHPKAEAPPLTPFSAIVPARFIAVPRLNIHITLETIHEEENEEEVMSQNSSSPSFLSTCFLEVEKPLASYSHNCKCA